MCATCGRYVAKLLEPVRSLTSFCLVFAGSTVQECVGTAETHMPPYPNVRPRSRPSVYRLAIPCSLSRVSVHHFFHVLQDVSVSATQLHHAVETVAATSGAYGSSPETAAVSPPLSFEAQVHRIHAVFGRLANHMNELKSYLRYHQRLVRRLEQVQKKTEGKQRDELIPAYVLQLFAKPRNHMEAHLRVLAQR